MDFFDKALAILIAWIFLIIFTYVLTFRKSRLFSSFKTRVIVAGAAMLTITFACSACLSSELSDYFEELTRAAGYELDFLGDFAYLEAQNTYTTFTLFMNLFGASVGGNLLYKGLYPSH